LFPEGANCLPISSALGTGDGVFNLLIGRVFPPAFSSIVLGKLHCLDKLIQLIQVDIAEDRTAHPTLWCPTEGFVPAPLFEISCLEHVSYEPQKSVVMNAFTQDAQEDPVIKSSKTL
jgi:hypothetical protein